MKHVCVLLALLLALAACNAMSSPAPNQETPNASATGGMGMRMGMMMGANGGMMTRHRAAVPEAYAGKVSTTPADDESLARGATVYTTHCASCHGDGGMGDGPAGLVLDPVAAPIAHTSQMMGDDYLLWRISEGGVPFGTAMPPWKEILDEQAQWDVINYVRALGTGQVAPGKMMGGAAFDPQIEAANRAQMLAQAVEQAVITQTEADTFATVHAALDAYQADNPSTAGSGSPYDRQMAMLAALIDGGVIDQTQADVFNSVHDRLHEAGLMQ
jgi:mono/diheme cytochrome c family protein